MDCLSTRLFLDGPKIAEEFEVHDFILQANVLKQNSADFFFISKQDNLDQKPCALDWKTWASTRQEGTKSQDMFPLSAHILTIYKSSLFSCSVLRLKMISVQTTIAGFLIMQGKNEDNKYVKMTKVLQYLLN